MEISTVIGLLIIGTIIELILSGLRKRKIEEKIELMGGEVIDIERRNFFKGIGPFMIAGRGRVIYRIEYYLGGETKEGWVKFGILFGSDWKL